MKKIINMEALTKAISKEKPAGFDLRKSKNNLYREIKDLRNHAKSVERKNLQQVSFSSKTEWKAVFHLSTDILTNHTKDLEITAWLIESLLRLHGFLGLAEGFILARKLIDGYFDHLYPKDDGDVSFSATPFVYLNGVESEGALISPIALIPLTSGENNSFALWQYQQALEMEKNINFDDLGTYPTLKEIINSANQTNHQFFDNTKKEIKYSLNEFSLLCEVFDERYLQLAPPSSRIKNQLEACLSCVEALFNYEKNKIEPTHSLAEIQANVLSENDKDRIFSTVSFDSRLSALQAIASASDYFKKTEPHSPLPYLLDKALSWGKMDFPILLQELIQDELIRKQIYYLTGVKDTH